MSIGQQTHFDRCPSYNDFFDTGLQRFFAQATIEVVEEGLESRLKIVRREIYRQRIGVTYEIKIF